MRKPRKSPALTYQGDKVYQFPRIAKMRKAGTFTPAQAQGARKDARAFVASGRAPGDFTLGKGGKGKKAREKKMRKKGADLFSPYAEADMATTANIRAQGKAYALGAAGGMTRSGQTSVPPDEDKKGKRGKKGKKGKPGGPRRGKRPSANPRRKKGRR